jgi:hypothetical protein
VRLLADLVVGFCLPLQILSKTSESKGRIDKVILKAAPIVAEVEKSGKSVEKTLKAEQVGEEASMWTRHVCAVMQWQ